MFDLSFAELALIVLVAVIFIGPKDLPVVIRALKKLYRQLSDLTGELKQSFADIAKDEDFVDAREEMEGLVRYIKDEQGHWHKAYDVTELPKRPAPTLPETSDDGR